MYALAFESVGEDWENVSNGIPDRQELCERN